jgi:hypothetical protein
MRKLVGGAFSGIGCLFWGIFGLIAFLVNFSIVINGLGWGFLGGVLAFMFFPVTIVFAPLYAFIAWGNPLPQTITYGGGIAWNDNYVDRSCYLWR